MMAVTVCATTPVAAQVTGTVYGTIKDEQGSVVPGATLVLTSETRGTKSAPAITPSARGETSAMTSGGRALAILRAL